MAPGDDTAFDTEADAVPTVGGADALTLVDGRTFVISHARAISAARPTAWS